MLALVLAPTCTWAEAHNHSHHGGQEVTIGAYHAELVVKGPEITLHINDAKDQAVDATGFSATATVLGQDNKQRSVPLTHAGENRLAGKYDFAIKGNFRAVITLRTPKGEAGKGRYNLKLPR